MPRRGLTEPPEINEEAYELKMLRLHGAALALIFGPELAYTIASRFVSRMKSRWHTNFGEFRTRYWKAVAPILDAHGLKGPERAKYRAFMNEVVAKVFVRGRSGDLEAIIRSWVDNFNADEGICREIVEALQKIFG